MNDFIVRIVSGLFSFAHPLFILCIYHLSILLGLLRDDKEEQRVSEGGGGEGGGGGGEGGGGGGDGGNKGGRGENSKKIELTLSSQSLCSFKYLIILINIIIKLLTCFHL